MTMPAPTARRSVTVARIESDQPMGQEEADAQLIRGLAAEGFEFRAATFTAWRGPAAPGRRRIWLSGPSRLPPAAHPLLALHAYGRGRLVHRLDGRLPPARGEVLTIQDVAPLRFGDEGAWPTHATIAARRAAAVVVPSRSSERDVRDLLGAQRVHVIPLGVDPACWSAGEPDRGERAAVGVDGHRYVLYAGGSTQRKNLAGLAGAWRRVRSARAGLRLLVCGPPSESKTALFGELAGCLLLGRVERGLLLRLMAGAEAVVVPSVYEGFGLPVLEAMAAGTVVVAAAASSLPEVGGDAAVLVDPSAEGLAAGILAAVDAGDGSRIEAGRRWARRFDWAVTARAHVALYDELGAGAYERAGRSSLDRRAVH
jgi:glycosyltransferase involved in cell wall biosynthesis